MVTKQRLDALLIQRKLVETRSQAQAAIMDGKVLVNGEKVTKSGQAVAENAKIELLGSFTPPPYVSRGGLKLEKALKVFNIDPNNRICLDIGASTGGFTDCLLKHGAKKVYAVDVGYNQLDWKIRSDPRVVVLEKTNARNLSPEILYGDANMPTAQMASLLVMDVSFISIAKVLPSCKNCLTNDAEMICLIKPQFEAGKEQVEKGGIVRSQQVHIETIENLEKALAEEGIFLNALDYSPVKGATGNIEFLGLFSSIRVKPKNTLMAVVEESHAQLHSNQSSQI